MLCKISAAYADFGSEAAQSFRATWLLVGILVTKLNHNLLIRFVVNVTITSTLTVTFFIYDNANDNVSSLQLTVTIFFVNVKSLVLSRSQESNLQIVLFRSVEK